MYHLLFHEHVFISHTQFSSLNTPQVCNYSVTNGVSVELISTYGT
jgi:hypothetical protein